MQHYLKCTYEFTRGRSSRQLCIPQIYLLEALILNLNLHISNAIYNITGPLYTYIAHLSFHRQARKLGVLAQQKISFDTLKSQKEMLRHNQKRTTYYTFF